MALVRRIYRLCQVSCPLTEDYFHLAPHQEVALFAAGCFWGVEQWMRSRFHALLDVRCVYAGDPNHDAPVYEHLGDHAESVLIKFDTRLCHYGDLVLHFFAIHDPTERNRQGNDIGRQYRSRIWTFSDEQVKIAKRVRDKVDTHYRTKVNGQSCSTKIIQADIPHIWAAERRHQRYLEKHPDGYHCESHYKREF